jgi:tetratricopeptide (TPR) repeat protein
MDKATKHEELLNQANHDIKDGFFDEATKKLEQIISENPNFGKAYNHLGYMYEVKFRDFDKGETLYKLAIEKSPLYTATYYNYAILLSTLGKFDELKELLDTALTIPGIIKATVYNEYGIMLEQQGKLDEAIEYYRKCALNSMDTNVIERAKLSIDRCRLKKEI